LDDSARNGFPVFQVLSGTPGFGRDEVRAASEKEDLEGFAGVPGAPTVTVPVSLLDVNVLLALAWPTHVYHLAAHRWFAENRLLKIVC
jgi:hypothetical protein